MTKLSYRKPLAPVILSIVDEHGEEFFDLLVNSFRLTICLWVVRCWGVPFYPQDLEQFFHEFADELGSSVAYYFLWYSVFYKDSVSVQRRDPFWSYCRMRG